MLSGNKANTTKPLNAMIKTGERKIVRDPRLDNLFEAAEGAVSVQYATSSMKEPGKIDDLSKELLVSIIKEIQDAIPK